MTNLVEFGERKPVEHEARKWLIRMDGDEPLTAAEKRSLKEWMGRSPQHRTELLRLAKFWAEANILTQLQGDEFASDSQAQKKPSLSGLVPRLLIAVSALFASVMVTYTGVQQLAGTTSHTYATEVGQQKTVVLSDNSTLQLNTDSRVEMIYTRTSRTFHLARGEAHFTAKEDPSRVFEVRAAGSVVRAIGTEFNVHVDGQRVEVFVTRGLVEVSDSVNQGTTADQAGSTLSVGSPITVRLKEGEITTFYSGSGQIPVRQLTEPELQRRMSWQEDYLEFSGEALGNVIEAFNRYSTVKLELADPELAPMAVSGNFQLGDLDAAVKLLTETCGLRAQRVDATKIRLEPQADTRHRS